MKVVQDGTNGEYYMTGVKTQRCANRDIDDSLFTYFKNLLVYSRFSQTFFSIEEREKRFFLS